MKSVLSKFISRNEHRTIDDPNSAEIVQWSRLITSNEYRNSSGLLLVEGLRAVEMIFNMPDYSVTHLIINFEEANKRDAETKMRLNDLLITSMERKIEIISVSREVFRQLADVNRPRGIIAIARRNLLGIEDLIKRVKKHSGMAIVTIGINDPGNMGTIMRSGVAFGASALFALSGSVDPFNPKVLRAATGHILPAVKSEDWSLFHKLCKREKIKMIGLESDPAQLKSIELDDLETVLNEPVAICIGSEGKGFPQEVRDFDRTILIPMDGAAESLNAGVAASIILYKFRRKKN
jgi:RNA methyltransferase, TrmH family